MFSRQIETRSDIIISQGIFFFFKGFRPYSTIPFGISKGYRRIPPPLEGISFIGDQAVKT